MEELLEHAPEGLPLAERMAGVVVAQWANDETRAGWPGMDRLIKRTGLKVRAIQNAIAGLVAAGVVVRVPVGTDRHGNPVYAHRGRRAEFRLAPQPWLPAAAPDAVPPAPDQPAPDSPGVIPPMPESPAEELPELSTAPPESPHQDAPFPPEKGRTKRGERAHESAERAHDDAPHLFISLQESLQIDARALATLCITTVEALAERTGTHVEDDHALLVIRQLLRGRPGIRSPARYVRAAIERDPAPTRFLPTPTPPRYSDAPGRPA